MEIQNTKITRALLYKFALNINVLLHRLECHSYMNHLTRLYVYITMLAIFRFNRTFRSNLRCSSFCIQTRNSVQSTKLFGTCILGVGYLIENSFYI